MKRWAYSAAEANRMFLQIGTGTCANCGIEFHRVARAASGLDKAPPHNRGEQGHAWRTKIWHGGRVTTYHPGGTCPGGMALTLEARASLPPERTGTTPFTPTSPTSRTGTITQTGKRPRDSQRGKLYEAECNAEWSPKAELPISLGEARSLAQEMVDWLNDQGYDVPATCTVQQRRGSSAEAWRSAGLIKIGTRAMVPWIVAHEVAHLVSPRASKFPGVEWDRDGRAHGWEFADVYLVLVRKFLGSKNERALRESFKAGGVKFRPKRRMSPEAKAAAAARLVQYREKVSK